VFGWSGVFVITGVKTCGGGTGYCILGGDCTVDKEFIADTGHCDGLRKAFTPRAYFVCCSFVNGKKGVWFLHVEQWDMMISMCKVECLLSIYRHNYNYDNSSAYYNLS